MFASLWAHFQLSSALHQCLQYKTDQAQDVKKIEKLHGKLMRLMVSKESHSGAMETDWVVPSDIQAYSTHLTLPNVLIYFDWSHCIARFLLLLFAVDSRWTTYAVAFWSWWCGHGMFCKVSGKTAELSLQECCCSSWWKDQMCLQLSGDNYTWSLFIMLLQCILHRTVANCCVHIVFK